MKMFLSLILFSLLMVILQCSPSGSNTESNNTTNTKESAKVDVKKLMGENYGYLVAIEDALEKKEKSEALTNADMLKNNLMKTKESTPAKGSKESWDAIHSSAISACDGIINALNSDDWDTAKSEFTKLQEAMNEGHKNHK